MGHLFYLNIRKLSILISLLFCVVYSSAQINTTVKIKASFISNFYKYVEWPNNAIKDTFCIGVLKDTAIANQIVNATKNRTYGPNKIPFKVTEIENLENVKMLNILFADVTSGYSAAQLFSSIKDKSVLLITENYGYNETMINFLVKDNKVLYQVNLSTIEPRNLIVDNRVLNSPLVFVGESEDWDKELVNLRVKLNKERIINKQLSSSIEEKEKILAQKEQALDEIKTKIQAQRAESDRLMRQMEVDKAIIDQKEEYLKIQEQKIEASNKKLEEVENDYKEVQDNMNQTMALLNNQKIFTSIAIMVAILIAILLFFAYQNYRKQKSQAVIINRQKVEAELQRDEISKQHIELEVKTKEITDSINYAKRIQEAMLPPLYYFNHNVPNNFIFYLPKDIVAGDFYWMEATNDWSVFAAADCTGHGVPGAMVSVICANALNRSVREYKLTEPARILDKTLEIVLEKFEKSEEDVKDGMDISLCAFNGKTGKLQYAGANNPLWVVRKGTNNIEEYKANKQPIGSYLHHEPFRNHSLELKDGDTAYLFSDGYADQFGGELGKKFKTINFKNLLTSIAHMPIEEQFKEVKRAFYDWKGDFEQLDDICIIGFKK